MRSGKLVLAASIAAAVAVAAAPTTASAKPHTTAVTPKVLSTAVIAPFNIAIGTHRILVADGGSNTLSKVLSNGTLKTIANGPEGGEVAGVAIGKGGRSIGYTTTVHPSDFENTNGSLHIRHAGGGTLTADIVGYENAKNPDHKNTYGAVGTVNDCAKAVLEGATGHPVTYTGVTDSHPYSVATYKNGSWLIADAGANAIFKVDRFGKISTVAVLPPQPLTITAEMAAAAHLPDCVVGVTYRFEPVPTDVEVGHNGQIYVTVLAGGPEDPAFGARSKVYRINPKTHHRTRIASGLSGATNLAILKGKVYVAEFYAGQVSVIKKGKPSPLVTLPGVVSVESGRGHLYAGTFASDAGPGTVVRLDKTGKASVLATTAD